MSASRTCTIMFTDLVASTELRTTIGDDAFDDRRREHERLLDDEVQRHGGEVVKRAGDGVMATFAAAADAVGCAVAMQRAVVRDNQRRAFPLMMRVAMSAGDVVFEDGDCHGTPVVEASRLCDLTPSGQILVADLVRALAGSRGGHTFVPVGPVMLKGLSESIPVCEVTWSLPADEQLEVPARLREIATRGACVGRDAEVAEIISAWKLVASGGERRLVLVAGEPGIGKTRIASELASRVATHGGVALHGWCDEDLSAPYQPWVQALGPFVRAIPDDELAELVGDVAPDLARLLPDVSARLPNVAAPRTADSDTERARAVDAIDAFLEAACARQPMLVVLDDLHWADRPSLVLLRRLLQSDRGGALMLLGTYRDTDVDRRHPLTEVLADLRRMSRVTRIALGGLDEDGLAALLADRAGHDAPEAFVRLLLDDTDGNPFFVEEVIAHLVETGVIYRRDGEWRTDFSPEEIGIPEGVRDVVGRRLSRLSPEANEVLAVAAFIGREFDASTLVAASGRDRDEVLDTLDVALASALVREIPGAVYRFAFSHALVRQTLTEEVRGARRARLHWRVGETLAAGRDSDLSAVAFHLCEGVLAGDAARAAEAAVAAAERAIAVAAPEEASALAARALEIVDDEGLDTPVLRAHALVIIGEAAGPNVTDVTAARHALVEAGDLARAHGATDLLVRAAFAFTPLFTPGEVLPAATSLSRAALEVLDGDDPRRALLLGVQAQFRYHDGEFAEGQRDVDEAVAIADASGDPRLRAAAYNARCFLLAGLPDVDTFETSVRAARDADDEAGLEQWNIRGFQGTLAVRRADRRRLEALRAEMREISARNPNVARELLALVWDGALAVADGRVDDIDAIAGRMIATAAPGSPFEAFGLALSAVALTFRGRIRELLEIIDTMFHREQPGLDRNIHGLRANLQAQIGEVEQARASVALALPDGANSLTPDYNRPGVLTYAGGTAVATHMTDVVASLLPEVERYRDEVLVGPWGFRAYEPGASLYASMLTMFGRHDEAVESARAGLALISDFGPYHEASARLRLAASLIARNNGADRDEAQRALDLVLEFCSKRGIVPEVHTAEMLLAECET